MSESPLINYDKCDKGVLARSRLSTVGVLKLISKNILGHVNLMVLSIFQKAMTFDHNFSY